MHSVKILERSPGSDGILEEHSVGMTTHKKKTNYNLATRQDYAKKVVSKIKYYESTKEDSS